MSPSSRPHPRDSPPCRRFPTAPSSCSSGRPCSGWRASCGAQTRRACRARLALALCPSSRPFVQCPHAYQAPGGHPQLGDHRQEALHQPARVHARGRYRGGRRGGCRCLLGRRVHRCRPPSLRRTAASSRTSRPARSASTGEKAEHLGTDHHLQQLLRVRHRQGRSPSLYAKSLKTEPVDGGRRRRVRQAGRLDTLEDILKGQTLEERIYRLRCVEAWSMVIPWVGFPLADFIKRVEPTSKAKFVEFNTLVDSDADARRPRRRCCAGRTSKGCGWTRRCIR